jgi:hypothetical protein
LALAFMSADRAELAIRCVFDRVGESMHIRRLCPNFDRRHARRKLERHQIAKVVGGI